MRYDFDSLYEEAQKEAFLSGKRRFYDNKVQQLTQKDVAGKLKITAQVVGKSSYSTNIIFDETGGLYDYSCNCGDFSMESGPCRHIIATALTFEEKNPQITLDDAAYQTHRKTDTAAINLITEYQKKRKKRYMPQSSQKAKLVPILGLNQDGKLYLRFMLGANKLYILKDISDFVSAYSHYYTRRFGAELELEIRPENFTDESNILCEFLAACYRENSEKAVSSVKSGKHQSAYKNELLLSSGDIDDFMELSSGCVIQFEQNAIKDGFRQIDTSLDSADIRLRVKGDENGCMFSFLNNKINIIEGKKYGYVVTDSKICRTSKDFYSALEPAIRTLTVKSPVFVASRDMPQFYNSVVVPISKCLNIESENVELARFEAAPVSVSLYIEENDIFIEAKLAVKYDETEVNIFSDDEITDFVRDDEVESRVKELLLKYFPEFPTLILRREQDIYNFLLYGVKEFFETADIYLSPKVKKMKIKKSPRVKVGVRLNNDLIKVEMDAEDYTSDDIKQILSGYKEKKSYVRLKDGSFVDLLDPTLQALSDILAVSGKDGDILVLPKYYAPFVDNSLNEGFFSMQRDAEFKGLIKSLNDFRNADINVPDSLATTMRNYQKTGFRWLKTIAKHGFGGILADDMGLGKSIQVISLLLSENKGTSLIVCPTSLILNWENEFKKFAPELKVQVIMGNPDERKAKLEFGSKLDVIITSYELIRRDEEQYTETEFDFIVIDEAQYIKNPETKNARSVKSLNAKTKLALTGTPIENSLSELWSIFDFIMPGYLYSYRHFKERFETAIAGGDDSAAKNLSKLVSPFILRRLKSNVLLELPPKIESTIEAPLDGKQRELYFSNLALIKSSLSDAGPDFNKIVALSMLTKLRQLCCEPRLIYPDYQENSAKLDAAIELIEQADAGGHKILLFSQFTSMLDVIKNELIKRNLSYFLLKGDTPKAERMRLVTRFNQGAAKVFLISLKAGGTGLNLTGADVVIHYDPWWNESVMNQATDRAYRIGQDKPVQVYKLVLKDTIEEKIIKLQEKKSALSRLIMDNQQTSNLSYKQILDLL